MANRLTEKQKKEIIAYYTECNNYSETARKYNISEGTVRYIIKNNKEFAKIYEQKSIENTNTVLEAMDNRRKEKIELLDDILKAMKKKATDVDMFTNIKDLATAYGIILDKELKVKELQIKEKELKDKNENSQETLDKLDEVLSKIGGVV